MRRHFPHKSEFPTRTLYPYMRNDLDVKTRLARLTTPWFQPAIKALAFAVIATAFTAVYSHSVELDLAGGLLGGLLTAFLDLAILGLTSNRRQAAWLEILNTSECGTFTVDFQHNRFRASDSLNEMLGYKPHNSPQTRDAFRSLIHPEERAALAQATEDYFAKRTDCIFFECRVKRGDGAWQWIRCRAKVVEWNRRGTPKRSIGITWDIDKSRRAAEHQAEMTRFMESTLSSIPAHIAVIDQSGTILLANSNWSAFAGPPNSMGERPTVGANYIDRLRSIAHNGDDIAGAAIAHVTALFSGALAYAHLEYETGTDTDRRMFALRFIRFDLSAGPRVTVIHRDITETRRIEQTLRENEERWKFAIDGSGDAVWDWNLVSDAMHRSAHFLKMLGRSSDGGFETFASMQALVHPEDAALVNGKYAGLIAGDQDLCAFEHRLRHRDGSWRWILARCTVTRRDAQQRALRILGVHTDITALKQAESQLRAKEAENEALEAERRLSQKLQSVGQLAAGIAHEINTPVQFVGDSITFIDEAWQELEPLMTGFRASRNRPDVPDEADGKDADFQGDPDVDFLIDNFPVAVSRARDGLARVSGIVRAMKEFSHPDQGDFSRADVNRAVQNAIVVARNEYKYVGIVETDYGTLPSVKCRISGISQVLLNLIVNAGHALADQGRTPASGRITINTRRDNEWIVISVADNGCGIPDQIRDRIFDPFFTSKEVGRGTGQGLAIARAIVVEQHGGRIVVKSTVGEGSTFEVWLRIEGPIATESIAEPARATG